MQSILNKPNLATRALTVLSAAPPPMKMFIEWAWSSVIFAPMGHLQAVSRLSLWSLTSSVTKAGVWWLTHTDFPPFLTRYPWNMLSVSHYFRIVTVTHPSIHQIIEYPQFHPNPNPNPTSPPPQKYHVYCTLFLTEIQKYFLVVWKSSNKHERQLYLIDSGSSHFEYFFPFLNHFIYCCLL